jgi:iron complex transport system ATP-binding protein
MSPIVEAVSIAVRVGSKTILDDVSGAFEPGRTVALVGPNGAGKSTLLRVLAGEIAPQSGQVRLHRRALTAYSPRALALNRAVLSQHVNVAFPFSVADIVRMGVADRGGAKGGALVEATLDEVGLHGFAHRDITTLSGGEQQRVHFARALVQLAGGREAGGPGILLLDEPTASLDLRHQLAVLDAIRRRASAGALVIAVLHDLNLAALCADRIIVLDRGRISHDGRPEETITAAMLAGVFGIETTVGRAAGSLVPFVLPQTMKPRAP